MRPCGGPGRTPRCPPVCAPIRRPTPHGPTPASARNPLAISASILASRTESSPTSPTTSAAGPASSASSRVGVGRAGSCRKRSRRRFGLHRGARADRDGTDAHPLPETGNDGVPPQLLVDPGAQGRRGVRLAVHDVDRVGSGVGRAQPVDQLHAVGVHRERGELHDLGVHGHVVAEQLDLPGALQEASAPRLLGLEPDEHDRRTTVGEVALQVVQHPTAGGHPGRRHHDGRGGEPIELHRLLDIAHRPDVTETEGIPRLPDLGTDLRPVLLDRPPVHLQSREGHRAVDEDGQLRDQSLLAHALEVPRAPPRCGRRRRPVPPPLRPRAAVRRTTSAKASSAPASS